MAWDTKRATTFAGALVMLAMVALLLAVWPGLASGNTPRVGDGPLAGFAPQRLAAAAAGERWVWQNPLPQGNDLNSVFFVDGQTGWAVGKSGAFIKTVDGGVNWAVQSSGTDAYLASVAFVDARRGWAVGGWGVAPGREARGVILHTEDGGNTWVSQNANLTGTFLHSVDFVDANTGWAVGWPGVVLKTTDGGGTWTSQTSGTGEDLRSVAFVDGQSGWVVGYDGTILHTSDGGTTWNLQSSGTLGALYAVDFVDARTGWAVGEKGLILKTIDGGLTWESRSVAIADNFFGVTFMDRQRGWVVGGTRDILYTPDGGAERRHPEDHRRGCYLDTPVIRLY